MKQDTIIGILHVACDVSWICSVNMLKAELAQPGCQWTARQYCDFRYSTNLHRFLFDPYTGEKLEWKEIKKLLESDE